MNDRAAIDALTSDLHWQIDQMGPRGIKNAAGHPYIPHYYKRSLKAAIDSGGAGVVDFVLRYVRSPPSGGYKTLEDANSLDLAGEALVADESKPYAHLFSDADRAAARRRLAPHLAAIEARTTARKARIEAHGEQLPDDLGELRRLAAETTEPELAAAVNRAILADAPNDVIALNRLGRATEQLGDHAEAIRVFGRVLELDAGNRIATGRLEALVRRRDGSRPRPG